MEDAEHNNTHGESRKYPRKSKKLPLYLVISNYDPALGESVNLSCNGVYCRTTKDIPEMTRLKISMELARKDGSNKFTQVECGGVVVRTENDPPNTDIYNLAIYFDEIDEIEKSKIAAFLESAEQ